MLKKSQKADNIEKHINKSAEEVQKKENKIRELQKYNSTLSTKLSQMKSERNSLQQTLNEVFGDGAFPESTSQASSQDAQTPQSTPAPLSTPSRKGSSTLSSPQASSQDIQTPESTPGIMPSPLSTPSRKCSSTLSSPQASSQDIQTPKSTPGIMPSPLSTPNRKCSTLSSTITPTRLFSPESSCKTPVHPEPEPSKTPPGSQEDVFGDLEIKKLKKH